MAEDFFSFVEADQAANVSTGYALYDAGNLQGAYNAWNLANRDNIIIGAPVSNFGLYAPLASFTGLPPLQIPSDVVLPGLSDAQLALITIVAPATPPPSSTAPAAGGSPPAATGTSPPATSSTTPPASTSPTQKPQELIGGSSGGSVGGYCDEFPEDPICGLWGGPGPIVISTPGGLDAAVTETVTINEGINSVDVDQIVDGSLDGLWAAAVDDVDAVVAAVVADVQSALTGIANALKAAWNVLSRLGGFILTFLSSLWQDVVKGLLAALHAVADALSALYNDVLVPLAQAMQSVRDWLLQLYRDWLRPVLIILQDLRQVLAILKLFNLKFAAKLDAAIADVQTRILQPVYWLLSYTNAVANWVNLIVTANYLIQQPLWLASLQAYLGQTINMQVNAMNPPVDAATLATIQATTSFPNVPQTVADIDQFFDANSGALAGPIASYSSVFDSYQGRNDQP
jgi:hypothetical protein